MKFSRMALLALLSFLLCATPISLSQTAKSKRRARPKPKTDYSKPFETRCGVRYPSFDEFVKETQDYWFEISVSSSSKSLYNPTKVLCDEKGMLKVWIKAVEIDTSKRLSHSMTRFELNCRKDQMRVLSDTSYDKNGAVIRSETVRTPEWEEVIPDSVGETILNTVCRKPV